MPQLLGELELKLKCDLDKDEIVHLHNEIRHLIEDNIGSNEFIGETVDDIIKLFLEVK